MDEKKALNKKSEENTTATTPVTEEKASEEVSVPEEIAPEPEVKAEPTAEPEVEETKPEEKPRKGYSKRVRELNAAKLEAEKGREEAEEEAKSLADKVAELTRSDEPRAGFQPTQAPQPVQPLVAPGEEIDALELDKRLREREQRSIQRTDALIQLRGKQQDAINKVVQESNEAVRDYPELDPGSKSFNKDLSESVTEAVEAHIRANPYNASVKKFVGRLMKPYQRAVTKEVGKVTEDIAKQSSQAALKPTSVRKGEKSAEDMSIKELEKRLGTVQG